MERHRFPDGSDDLPNTMPKLYLFTKFPHEEIRPKYGILRREKQEEVLK